MPKPVKDIDSIEEALEYRKRGLKPTEISRLMGKDRKTIWRWFKYFDDGDIDVASFPQKDLQRRGK